MVDLLNDNNDIGDKVDISQELKKIQLGIKDKCTGLKESYIVYLKASKQENGLEKYIVIIDKDKTDKIICCFEFNEEFKDNLTNLVIAIGMPIELDEYGIIDLKEANKWFNNNLNECEYFSKKVYNKHIKRFE